MERDAGGVLALLLADPRQQLRTVALEQPVAQAPGRTLTAR